MRKEQLERSADAYEAGADAEQFQIDTMKELLKNADPKDKAAIAQAIKDSEAEVEELRNKGQAQRLEAQSRVKREHP